MPLLQCHEVATPEVIMWSDYIGHPQRLLSTGEFEACTLLYTLYNQIGNCADNH